MNRLFARSVWAELVFWGFSSIVLAQTQPGPVGQVEHGSGSSKLILDVVVTDKAGKPVDNLQQQDFTVFDDKQPQKLLSFRRTVTNDVSADASAGEPLKTLLLIDEVNVSFNRIASEHDQIKKFFLQNGGKLPHPVALVFYTDSGIELQKSSKTDGNVLQAEYDQHVTGLRAIAPAAGADAAVEQFQRSLRTLNTLAGKLKQEPGRKQLIWVGPGWPIQPTGRSVDLNAEQERGLFTSLVIVWRTLRQARVTLYMVDPFGVDDAGGRSTYYEDFLKPVTTSKRIQVANLALQVFARKSGGLVLNSSNDIAAELNRCLADADAYYTLEVDTGLAERPDKYHPIEVKVPSGLTARTREGYYAQP